jgi:hypothetical protein
MKFKQYIATLTGIVVLLRNAESRDERGLSQSAEGAILIAGAVTIAIAVIAFLTVWVPAHMPR